MELMEREKPHDDTSIHSCVLMNDIKVKTVDIFNCTLVIYTYVQTVNRYCNTMLERGYKAATIYNHILDIKRWVEYICTYEQVNYEGQLNFTSVFWLHHINIYFWQYLVNLMVTSKRCINFTTGWSGSSCAPATRWRRCLTTNACQRGGWWSSSKSSSSSSLRRSVWLRRSRAGISLEPLSTTSKCCDFLYIPYETLDIWRTARFLNYVISHMYISNPQVVLFLCLPQSLSILRLLYWMHADYLYV